MNVTTICEFFNLMSCVKAYCLILFNVILLYCHFFASTRKSCARTKKLRGSYLTNWVKAKSPFTCSKVGVIFKVKASNSEMEIRFLSQQCVFFKFKIFLAVTNLLIGPILKLQIRFIFKSNEHCEQPSINNNKIDQLYKNTLLPNFEKYKSAQYAPCLSSGR